MKRKRTPLELRNMEEYVAYLCSRYTKLDYWQTPHNTEYDFQLFDERDIRILGEIKIRSEIFPDWFVADKKINWLLKTCNAFRCVPWFVIYSETTKATYILNLNHHYTSRAGEMMNTELQQPVKESGQFIPLEFWQVIDSKASFEEATSQLDWK